ncbi:hypothetical protein [Amycolatopsis thermophila]|uniref:Uncharacterized protein n=1 Tax=Amycolatopsis thermophila TaxID=206084 RepID=A0ABU0EQ91_9PSEU|nr:hypothetical protein [Amycolatopsis thermophila]MDQ0377464.1 hypothetical protein [Amycolatopsis thermophila]
MLPGCALILASIVIGFAWNLAASRAMGWYKNACHVDLDGPGNVGLLAILVPQLLSFIVYSGIAGWVIVWRCRRWLWRVLALVVTVAGAVLLTWAFWTWQLTEVVPHVAELGTLNPICLVDDPPGWPSFFPIHPMG